MTVFTDPHPLRPEYNSFKMDLDSEFKFYFQEYIKLTNEWVSLIAQLSGVKSIDENVIPYDASSCAMRLLDIQAQLQKINYYWSDVLETWKITKLKWDYSLNLPVNTMMCICLPNALYPINIPVLHTEDSVVTVDDDDYFYIKVPIGGLPKGTIIYHYDIGAKCYISVNLDKLYLI